MFQRITGSERIREVLHSYMLRPKAQRAPFVATIALRPGVDWNGQMMRGGLRVEGARPFSAVSTPGGETTYSLTNSDSGYQRSIGRIHLSDVEYLELMPESPWSR